MPLWTDMLEISTLWGIPPWDVEDAPAEWIDRQREWAQAKIDRQERVAKEAERKRTSHGTGGRQVKRLI